jgi:hypothetical protein
MVARPRHLIAVVCVLLLNLQLFAANALGCVHTSGGELAAMAHCPHASPPSQGQRVVLETAADQLTQDGLALSSDAGEPCQKCNLGKVAAGWHLVGQAPTAITAVIAALPHARGATPVLIRSDDDLLRPPRAISG